MVNIILSEVSQLGDYIQFGGTIIRGSTSIIPQKGDTVVIAVRFKNGNAIPTKKEYEGMAPSFNKAIGRKA